MLYMPQEDSYLLKKSVEEFVESGQTFLDMGCGTAIQGKAAKEKGAIVTTCDIDQNAQNELNFIKSDLFENITEQYEVIAFNPPYLPLDENEPEESRLQTTGGKHGYEIPVRFIEGIGNHLKTDGFCLLLISNLTHPDVIEKELEKHSFTFEVVDKQSMFMEQLFIYKIGKSSNRKEWEKKGVTNIAPFMHGKRGTIFTGDFEGKKIAIKEQRSTTTSTIEIEARLLQDLKLDFGPQVLFRGKNYFAYDFIEGVFFPAWLESASKENALTAIKLIYDYMFYLDEIGYNKEEMHHPFKHIIMSKNKPYLVDFERCRASEKVHNVTQFTQYVVSLREVLEANGINIDKDVILQRTQEYSHKRIRANFEVILAELN